jgi:hypothetical protein
MPTTPATDAASVQDTAATRLWPVWVAATQAARSNPSAESAPPVVANALEIAALAAIVAAWTSLRRRPGGKVTPPARLDEYDFRTKAQEVTNEMAPRIWEAAKQHAVAQPPETDTTFAREATYSSSAEMMSRAQIAFAKELGLKYKIWISRGDARVRKLHRELHGGTVPLDAPFVEWGPQRLDFPGDPRAPLDAIVNCRCIMALSPTKRGVQETLRPSNLTDAFGIAAALEQEWIG